LAATIASKSFPFPARGNPAQSLRLGAHQAFLPRSGARLGQRVSAWRDEIQALETKATRWILVARVGITVLLGWRGLGQLSLLLSGWKGLRPGPSVRSSGELSSALDAVPGGN
jgi:hypothetical protein